LPVAALTLLPFRTNSMIGQISTGASGAKFKNQQSGSLLKYPGLITNRQTSPISSLKIRDNLR
jgi:hypothetical protein